MCTAQSKSQSFLAWAPMHTTTMPAESRAMKKVAADAALSVGDDLRSAFRSPIDVGFKRDEHDVVTVHDRAAEDRIREIIVAAVPDSTIIGEEGGALGEGRVRWFVDPIDGTSNFARGLSYWCVSIAAEIEGRIVAGVVYEPMTGNVFAADLDGATLNGAPMDSRAATEETAATLVSSFPAPNDLTLFGSRAMDLQERFVRRFRHVRNLGSGALNLAHVAAGWADATMGFDTKPWDVAAGAFILEQAGGTFRSYRGGRQTEPSHLGDDYYGVGAGADYRTLADGILSSSTERGKRE